MSSSAGPRVRRRPGCTGRLPQDAPDAGHDAPVRGGAFAELTAGRRGEYEAILAGTTRAVRTTRTPRCRTNSWPRPSPTRSPGTGARPVHRLVKGRGDRRRDRPVAVRDIFGQRGGAAAARRQLTDSAGGLSRTRSSRCTISRSYSGPRWAASRAWSGPSWPDLGRVVVHQAPGDHPASGAHRSPGRPRRTALHAGDPGGQQRRAAGLDGLGRASSSSSRHGSRPRGQPQLPGRGGRRAPGAK